MAVEDALDDETGQRQHHLERMADDVRRVPGVEAIAGERRSATAAFVECERDVEVFERGEDPIVVGVVQRPPLRRVGTDHRRPHAARRDGAAQLLFGQRGIVQRHDGDTEQPAVALPAVVADPTVVRTGERRGEIRREVIGVGRVEREARIQRGASTP